MGVHDWPRVVAHVDMDAFYVSVELQRRPELRGLPVVVAGSGPRAVVTTASYEARRFGVFSATPAARARRLCPQAVFVAPDFEHYRARSREVMDVLRSQVERVEVVGLDEAYLDLSALGRPEGRRPAGARRAVQQATGLCCSIGIGPSKLVAKVASDADKPNGFVTLSQARGLRALRRRVAGADSRHRAEVGRAAAPPGHRDARPAGRCAPGAPRACAAWRASRTTASWSSTACASRSRARRPSTTICAALGELMPVLERLSEQLCADLERHERRGRTIGIKVRLDDFSTHTRARSVATAVNDLATVRRVAGELLSELDPPRPVRLLGVRVAGLDEAAPAPSDQMSLAL